MTDERTSRSHLADLAELTRGRIEAGLHRTLAPRPPGPPELLDLASNDYLGMHDHPEVIAAASAALRDYGLGSTGSRLVTGATQVHDELEDALADFMGFGCALTASSGYMANLAAVTALAGRGDLVVSDGGSHASLIDACRLSRARVAVTPLGDVAAIEEALATRTEKRALVISDAVYSTSGDIADVRALHDVCREHGAALLVDEAHGLGVVGPGGRGAVAAAGLAGAPDLVVTVTLSKSLGAQGGAILGPPELRDHLIDSARPIIFDTALAPPAAAGALAALRLLRDDPSLPDAVLRNARLIAGAWGVDAPPSAVVPVILGDPGRAVAARDNLRARGVLVGVFRPPSVPPGGSRLRITARANLTAAELGRAAPRDGDVPPPTP
ncbi:8-amino-7-oxononanoate synthase [Corynebacterium hansenii]|uniref:8-amino-7-oxononanoate synthase n=1 Tax=Corynebacterium hansenii TaxID=394964 RepID=A0ABV7ZNA3_9CORY|nr:8-amino-7-oxononanoate synthase [Corynebacterium hansenii]WJZ00237.1 8-amino-7-oxononanoate synthase 1 [Corynebacterium hansenii]